LNFAECMHTILTLTFHLQTPFAAPRVVNEALAHNISSQDDGVTANRPRNRRVTKLGDGVNNLPTNLAPLLPGLPDYFHFEPSYLINLPGQVLPSALNIDIVPGIDTLVPTLPPFIGLLPNNAALEETVAVHSFYLTWISECFSNGVVSRSRLITELGLPVPSTEYRKRGLRFTT
jgi:hypothetical protein